MAESPKMPGHYATVTFPITASFLLLMVIAAAAVVFHYNPTARETIKFTAEALAMGAGVLSAYYVGKGLQTTIEQRTDGLKANKVARAFNYISRWNDPSYREMKHEFRAIVESANAHVAENMDHLLTTDQKKRTTVVEILNFFEEMSISANMELADDATLKRAFKTMLTKYRSTLQAWQNSHRAAKGHPTAWTEIDKLLDRWNAT